jgi:hypothetical protein
MTAFNVVRFRVKPGREKEFLDFHRNVDADFDGFRGGVIVKTGERAYCFIGGWDDFDSIVAARPQMVGMLDEMRALLEDLGGDLGVTDPVSGETVVELPAKKAKKTARKRPQRARKSAPRSADTAGDETKAEPEEEA